MERQIRVASLNLVVGVGRGDALQELLAAVALSH